MNPYEDPQHPGNGPDHRTGKECIESECTRPAGTAWSPLWCMECNIDRMRRIDAQMERLTSAMCEYMKGGKT